MMAIEPRDGWEGDGGKLDGCMIIIISMICVFGLWLLSCVIIGKPVIDLTESVLNFIGNMFPLMGW